jgi:hypothetical protein
MYLYQKDAWALPENLLNRRKKSFFSLPPLKSSVSDPPSLSLFSLSLH